MNLEKNRVPFMKNRNKDDDSDYDDEDDSKIESCDDLASQSEADDGQGGKSKALADGSGMFDDLRRPDGEERQSLIEKDKDGN